MVYVVPIKRSLRCDVAYTAKRAALANGICHYQRSALMVAFLTFLIRLKYVLNHDTYGVSEVLEVLIIILSRAFDYNI